jgi:hypothetical protein
MLESRIKSALRDLLSEMQYSPITNGVEVSDGVLDKAAYEIADAIWDAIEPERLADY